MEAFHHSQAEQNHKAVQGGPGGLRLHFVDSDFGVRGASRYDVRIGGGRGGHGKADIEREVA